MMNNSSSKCKKCMVLLRLITAEYIFRNVRVFAKYVGTKDNGKADALRRLDFKRFWSLSGDTMNQKPSRIPSEIWPFKKLWKF